MAKFSELSLRSFLRNGAQLFGCKAFFYDAGTTTLRTMYQDADLTTAHASPVVMNASGMFPVIYAGVGNYRVRITDSAGGLIDDFDDLEGSPATVDDGGDSGAAFALVTGDMVFSYSTATRAGAVRANGRTIGSASSGATERANTDAEDLFLHLWNNNSNLAVSGGRGGSAALDWAANKPIALPDMRGRGPLGLDTMGNTAASRFTGITFGTGAGNAATLGSYGGSLTSTIAQTNLPAVSISVTVNSDGSHDHAGSVSDAIGAHLHSGSVTSFAGDHVHDYSVISTGGYTLEAGATATTFTTATISTGTSGNHQHSLSLVSDGNHQHALDIALDGAHTHTAATANLGSGTALATASGFVLGTWFILL